MPGKHGFPAYCAALAALPATAHEIATATGMTPEGAGQMMRRFWALGLTHPGSTKPRRGGPATVWHLGDGPAVSDRVAKKRPRALHILLASIVRALESAMTVRELAAEVGVSIKYSQQLLKHMKAAGMCFVAEWARDARGVPVARYEYGKGKDTPKLKPLSATEKRRRVVARKQTLNLHRAWAQAANEEREAA